MRARALWLALAAACAVGATALGARLVWAACRAHPALEEALPPAGFALMLAGGALASLRFKAVTEEE